MNYIPTYQEALEIVKAKGGIIFYETKHFVDGYQISIFNYRLAKYNDFISPIPGKNIDAKDSIIFKIAKISQTKLIDNQWFNIF